MSRINFYEAYSAVYNEDLRNELLEISDQFYGIEELNDDEIESIVEETVFEMLSEGYEIEDLEEVFEEFITEARVDMAARAKARKEYRASSEKSAKEARSRAAQVSRRERRAEAISKVKSAAKSAISKAKEFGKNVLGKAQEAGRSAKFHAIDKNVASYATKRNLHPAAGAAARSKDPEKRRSLRSKVASDIKGRITKRVAQAQVDAASKARQVGQSVTDAKNRAVQSATNKAAVAKRGVKSGVGKAARAVASGAGKVASRLGEDTEHADLFDLILEYLVAEGYADTNKNAISIMANMSEEWRDEIIDEANRGDEYTATKMHPNLVRGAKQTRRNASYEGGYTHSGAPRLTDAQKKELNKYGGAENEASRQTTLMRQRANKLTRGIKGKNR